MFLTADIICSTNSIYKLIKKIESGYNFVLNANLRVDSSSIHHSFFLDSFKNNKNLVPLSIDDLLDVSYQNLHPTVIQSTYNDLKNQFIDINLNKIFFFNSKKNGLICRPYLLHPLIAVIDKEIKLHGFFDYNLIPILNPNYENIYIVNDVEEVFIIEFTEHFHDIEAKKEDISDCKRLGKIMSNWVTDYHKYLSKNKIIFYSKKHLLKKDLLFSDRFISKLNSFITSKSILNHPYWMRASDLSTFFINPDGKSFLKSVRAKVTINLFFYLFMFKGLKRLFHIKTDNKSFLYYLDNSVIYEFIKYFKYEELEKPFFYPLIDKSYQSFTSLIFNHFDKNIDNIYILDIISDVRKKQMLNYFYKDKKIKNFIFLSFSSVFECSDKNHLKLFFDFKYNYYLKSFIFQFIKHANKSRYSFPFVLIFFPPFFLILKFFFFLISIIFYPFNKKIYIYKFTK